MNPLISVIVPVYNVEKYLDRCVESIINQTYTNLEIILVDDGSPDNCPAMCDKWAEKDERIRVIHKPNGGVSSARNTGIENSNGEYIAFVDSDDYTADNYVEALIKNLIDNDCDLVACNFNYVNKDSTFIKTSEYKKALCAGKHEILSDYLNEAFVDPGCPGKLYVKNVIDSLRFDENIKNGEDFLFNYYYLSECKKVIQIEDALYNYVQNPTSSTHIVTDSLVNRWKNTKRILSDLSREDEIYNVCLEKYVYELICCAKELLRSENKELIKENYPQIISEIRMNCKYGLHNKNYSVITKFAIFSISVFPNLFRIIYQMFKSFR